MSPEQQTLVLNGLRSIALEEWGSNEVDCQISARNMRQHARDILAALDIWHDKLTESDRNRKD